VWGDFLSPRQVDTVAVPADELHDHRTFQVPGATVLRVRVGCPLFDSIYISGVGWRGTSGDVMLRGEARSLLEVRLI